MAISCQHCSCFNLQSGGLTCALVLSFLPLLFQDTGNGLHTLSFDVPEKCPDYTLWEGRLQRLLITNSCKWTSKRELKTMYVWWGIFKTELDFSSAFPLKHINLSLIIKEVILVCIKWGMSPRFIFQRNVWKCESSAISGMSLAWVHRDWNNSPGIDIMTQEAQ